MTVRVATTLVMFFTSAVLFLLTCLAHAAVLSEHDRQDMALQRAIQLCQAKGGTFTWTMPQRYRLEDTAQGYIIRGNELLFVCTVKTTATTGKVLVSWSHPTTRANGAPLPVSQIAGYEIRINTQVIPVGVVTAWTITDVPLGSHAIALRTVDTDGRKSAESPVITVRVVG